MKKKIFDTSLLISLLLLSVSVLGQEPLKPRPSPLEVVTMKFEDTYVKITYSRPHKRDRDIFGSLVPYGEVWRTGANEATEITLTGDILINGDSLTAGTYSVFSIPQETEWTIILNSELGQWGAFNYKEKFDVKRFNVPVEKMEEIYEPFTILFEQKGLKNANIVMMWDSVRVTIPIEFLFEE